MSRYIDAEALKVQACAAAYQQGLDHEKILAFCTLLDMQPTADVVPVRRGRWMFDDFDGDGLDYQCTACHGYQRRGGRYCPDCGARMDLEAQV